MDGGDRQNKAAAELSISERCMKVVKIRLQVDPEFHKSDKALVWNENGRVLRGRTSYSATPLTQYNNEGMKYLFEIEYEGERKAQVEQEPFNVSAARRSVYATCCIFPAYTYVRICMWAWSIIFHLLWKGCNENIFKLFQTQVQCYNYACKS